MANQVTVNYSGRTVDLLIFQNTKPSGEQKISLDFGSENGGEVTTGIQKLAQSFTTLFLTELGSVPSEPTKGSTFVTAVRQQRIRDESDVQAEFNLAVENVRSTLNLAEDQGSFQDDEKFRGATLVKYNLDDKLGMISLYVNVVSAAGTSRQIYLPIPVPIR
jgi:hypothetical protein